MNKSRYWTKACAAVLLSAAAMSINGQTLANLWTFSGNFVFGAEASLIQGSDGNLYGITNDGGSHALGTVFKITTAGMLTTIYNFGSTSTDGAGPTRLFRALTGTSMERHRAMAMPAPSEQYFGSRQQER